MICTIQFTNTIYSVLCITSSDQVTNDTYTVNYTEIQN